MILKFAIGIICGLTVAVVASHLIDSWFQTHPHIDQPGGGENE